LKQAVEHHNGALWSQKTIGNNIYINISLGKISQQYYASKIAFFINRR